MAEQVVDLLHQRLQFHRRLLVQLLALPAATGRSAVGRAPAGAAPGPWRSAAQRQASSSAKPTSQAAQPHAGEAVGNRCVVLRHADDDRLAVAAVFRAVVASGRCSCGPSSRSSVRPGAPAIAAWRPTASVNARCGRGARSGSSVRKTVVDSAGSGAADQLVAVRPDQRCQQALGLFAQIGFRLRLRPDSNSQRLVCTSTSATSSRVAMRARPSCAGSTSRRAAEAIALAAARFDQLAAELAAQPVDMCFDDVGIARFRRRTGVR